MKLTSQEGWASCHLAAGLRVEITLVSGEIPVNKMLNKRIRVMVRRLDFARKSAVGELEKFSTETPEPLNGLLRQSMHIAYNQPLKTDYADFC